MAKDSYVLHVTVRPRKPPLMTAAIIACNLNESFEPPRTAPSVSAFCAEIPLDTRSSPLVEPDILSDELAFEEQQRHGSSAIKFWLTETPSSTFPSIQCCSACTAPEKIMKLCAFGPALHGFEQTGTCKPWVARKFF
eukprot:scaffold323091_cov21-Tisochrysis_lutea.AAC.1